MIVVKLAVHINHRLISRWVESRRNPQRSVTHTHEINRGKNRTDGSVVDTATMRMGMARVTPYLYQCLSDVELLCLKWHVWTSDLYCTYATSLILRTRGGSAGLGTNWKKVVWSKDTTNTLKSSCKASKERDCEEIKKVSSLFSPRSLMARTISNMSRITIMSSDTFMAIRMTRSRDRTCVVCCLFVVV